MITGSVRKAARSGRIRTEPMISTRPARARPAPGLRARADPPNGHIGIICRTLQVRDFVRHA